jgi:small conductance mechanosensitive channel
MDMQALQDFVNTTLLDLLIKVGAAIAFWIVGRWLIGKVISLMRAAMDRNQIDPTLTKYVGSIVSIALNIALVLGILGYFGIQTTSFAAMLAGAGVAIGAACSATSRPGRSCWCCVRSRWATSCRWPVSPAPCTSSGSSAPPS